MSFLPKDYSVPAQTSRYMKLQDGDNVFRVLSSAIIGWQYWNTDKKPVRLREHPKNTPEDIRRDNDGNPEKISHFWAFVVLDRSDGDIKILEITQSSVQKAIRELTKDDDWGDPREYDIKVTRTGERLETRYAVSPKPHKKIEQEVLDRQKEMNIDLTALYDGKDPFGAEEVTYPTEEELNAEMDSLSGAK